MRARRVGRTVRAVRGIVPACSEYCALCRLIIDGAPLHSCIDQMHGATVWSNYRVKLHRTLQLLIGLRSAPPFRGKTQTRSGSLFDPQNCLLAQMNVHDDTQFACMSTMSLISMHTHLVCLLITGHCLPAWLRRSFGKFTSADGMLLNRWPLIIPSCSFNTSQTKLLCVLMACKCH